MDSFTANRTEYVCVTGKVSNDGIYTNFYIPGASRICSITNQPSWLDLSSEYGEYVSLFGYYSDYNVSRNAHMIIYTGYEKGIAGNNADNPYTVSAAISLAHSLSSDDLLNDVYTTGIVSKIASIDVNSGQANYYISDSGSSNSLYVFRAYGLGGSKFTYDNQLHLGDEVIIKGKLMNYKGNTPEYSKFSKIVKLNGQWADDLYPATPVNIEDLLYLPDNSRFTLENAIVAAKSSQQYTLTDGRHNVNIFDGYLPDVNIGDMVDIDGVKTTYLGIPEAISADAVVRSSGNDVPRTTLIDITGYVDTYTSSEPDYICVSGVVSCDAKGFFSVTPPGATKGCMITNKPDELDLSSYVGRSITLFGYYGGFFGDVYSHMIIYTSFQ